MDFALRIFCSFIRNFLSSIIFKIKILKQKFWNKSKIKKKKKNKDC